ncbi:MAG: hypothetical protein ACRDRU_21800 [Pseudonocardiaceae bacterium]
MLIQVPAESVAATRRTTGTHSAAVMLLPDLVERMISARQAAQIVKFRTTCTDCVPNF